MTLHALTLRAVTLADDGEVILTDAPNSQLILPAILGIAAAAHHDAAGRGRTAAARHRRTQR